MRRQLVQILLGAVNRIERIVVPDMPAYGNGRLRRFHGLVDSGVRLAQTVSPKHFPRGEFRVAKQQTPELRIVAIDRPFAAAASTHVSSARNPSFARSGLMPRCFALAWQNSQKQVTSPGSTGGVSCVAPMLSHSAPWRSEPHISPSMSYERA